MHRPMLTWEKSFFDLLVDGVFMKAGNRLLSPSRSMNVTHLEVGKAWEGFNRGRVQESNGVGGMGVQ